MLLPLTVAAFLSNFPWLAPAAPATPELEPPAIARLILNERGKLKNASGWAADMRDDFREIDIPATRENVCAAIAIVSQESSFTANPEVPGLGKLAEKSLRTKLEGYPLMGTAISNWLESTPSSEASFMDQIRAARTERDLDLTYRAMVEYAANSTQTGILLNSGFLNKYIEEYNDISTIGSMQVSVAFALRTEAKERWLGMSLADVYAVRDDLYTRKGGMKYGILQLLGYDSGYDRKIYRFADYNAGRFASRNAAFQSVIEKLSGEKLARDGDLLSYSRPGKAKKKVTSTETAIRIAAKRHQLPLTDSAIRTDLLKEKTSDFTTTQTYVVLRDTYATIAGKPAAFAMVPEIDLHSVKIKNHMTTANFAESVTRRYQRCMAVK